MEGKQFKEKSKREHRKERMQISNNSKEIRSAKEKKNCKKQHPTSKTTAHTLIAEQQKSREERVKKFSLLRFYVPSI